MSFDAVIGAVKQQLPHFNDYTLRGYREEQISRIPDFVDTVFREAVQLFDEGLTYTGYERLPPEACIDYTVGLWGNNSKVNIQQSELELIRYQFVCVDPVTKIPENINVYLYLPYFFNDALVIKDIKYYMNHAILDKTIYRINDGVIIKVMRSPLQFWRNTQTTYKDTDGEVYVDTIATVKAFYRKTKKGKTRKTPLMLYLLARYDFNDLVEHQLGFPGNSIVFVNSINENEKDQYKFFECGNDIYLRVKPDAVLTDKSGRKFIASLLYTLKIAEYFSFEDVYNTLFYKMILGKLLYEEDDNPELAITNAEHHFDSLKTYLDKYSQEDLAQLGYRCNDIFDLFKEVFWHIDQWITYYSPNDLFEKRIGGADLILGSIIKKIFTRCYEHISNKKVRTARNISKMLKINAEEISSVWSVPSVKSDSSLYNDNVLIGTLIKKIRQASTQDRGSHKKSNLITAKEHQFHSSFIAIESALAISSSSPGVTGDINPFAAINSMGYFVKEQMPWYQEIEGLDQYLVHA